MHLKLSHEIVGTLHKIKTEQDRIRLIFGIYKEIEIPRESIPQEKLESVIRKKSVFSAQMIVFIVYAK